MARLTPKTERGTCGAITQKGTPCTFRPVWNKATDNPITGRCHIHLWDDYWTGQTLEEKHQRAQGKSSRYNFRDWEVGESLIFKGQRINGGAAQAAYKVGRELGYKFKVRSLTDAVQIERIA